MKKRVYKPDAEMLDESKHEAYIDAGTSETEWRAKYLKTVNKWLTDDPRRYRGFGYFWWGLKKALLNAGYAPFGDFIDKEYLALTDYGNDTDNIIAAQLFLDYAMAYGLQYAHNVDMQVCGHTMYEDDEDDETGWVWEIEQYHNHDEEAETQATAKQLLKK